MDGWEDQNGTYDSLISIFSLVDDSFCRFVRLSCGFTCSTWRDGRDRASLGDQNSAVGTSGLLVPIFSLIDRSFFHSVHSFCSFTRFTWRDGRDWHFSGPWRIRTAWSVCMVCLFQSFHPLIAHFFTLSVCFCSFTFSTQKEGRDWAFQALINLGRFSLSTTSTLGGAAHRARMPR